MPSVSSSSSSSTTNHTHMVSNLGNEWRKEWEQQLQSPPFSPIKVKSPSLSHTRSTHPPKTRLDSSKNDTMNATWRACNRISRATPLNKAMILWILLFTVYYGLTCWLTYRVWPHHEDDIATSSQRIQALVQTDYTIMRMSRDQQTKSDQSSSFINSMLRSNSNHHLKTAQIVRDKRHIREEDDKDTKNTKIDHKNKNDNNGMIHRSQVSPVFDKVTYNRGKEKSLRVGIAVTITKYPGLRNGFLDSLGSLVVSVIEANSHHNVSLIVLMHSNMTIHDNNRYHRNGTQITNSEITVIDVIRALGFDVIYRSLPFEWTEVKNRRIGQEMLKDGCCGMAELLKLWVWTLDDQFDYVLSLDADCHFHRNFDELFDIMDQGNYELGFTHGATARINQEVMNGGFLVVKPNKKHYYRMKEVLIEGDFGGGGWKKSGIGWVYGGRTIQGIVPYYFLMEVSPMSVISAVPIHARWMKERNFPNKSLILTSEQKQRSIGRIMTVKGSKIIEFERCKYNNMVEIARCKEWKFDQVTSNHFTVCQKPWFCIYQKMPICDAFRESWWRRSWKLEIEYLGMSQPRDECPKHRYQTIDYSKSPFIRRFIQSQQQQQL